MRLLDQTSGPLGRAAVAAQNMTTQAQAMNTQLAATNIAMGGAAAAFDVAIISMVKSAMQLEDSLARLETATATTVTSIETSLQNSSASAKAFSEEYAVAASTVVDAQFEMATAGIAVNEQVEATQAAYKLAKAAVGEFGQASTLLGSFLNTFGKTAEFGYLNPAEKMEKITDRLSVAVQKFQVTLPVLAESFKFIVGPASTLELKLSEVSAALGILNTAGFRGTLAGTALSNMFNKMDKAIEKLNLNPDKFIDLNGNLKDLTSFLEEVNRALANKTPIEQQNILIDTFDIRAGRVIKTLLNTTGVLRQFSNELEVSTGATERMANIIESTTSAQFTKLVNSINNVSIAMGGRLTGIFQFFIGLTKGLVQTFGEFITETGILIPLVLSAAAAFTTLATAVISYTVVSGVASAAIAAFAAGSVLATRALTMLRYAMRLVAAVAIATVIYEITQGLIWLGTKMYQTADSVSSLRISDKLLEMQFGSTIQKISQYTSEIDRLGKTVKGNVNFPLGKDEVLGKLPFADAASNAMRQNAKLSRPDAITNATEAAGGMVGIVKQLSEATGTSAKDNLEFAETFNKIKEATDRSFSSLNMLEKLALQLGTTLQGYGIGTNLIAENNQQAAEAIDVMLSALEKVSSKVASVEQKGKQMEKVFDAVKTAVVALSFSSNEAIKGIVAAFEEATDSSGNLTVNSTQFYRTIEKNQGLLTRLKNDIQDAGANGQYLVLAMNAIETPISQVMTSTKGIENALKNASLGGNSFAEAMKIASERSADAKKSFEGFKSAIAFARTVIDSFRDMPITKTPIFENLKKQLDAAEATQVELQFKINEGDAIIEANRVIHLIERSNKLKILPDQKADIEKLGQAFGDSIGKAMKGGSKDLTPFQTIANDFKSTFIGEIQKDLGLLLGNQFKDDFRSAINIARTVIEEAQLAGNLFGDWQSGKLAKDISDAVESAVPGIKKITGGDIMNLSELDQLAEKFNDIFTDAGISMVTAGAKSVGALEDLQAIISSGPATTFDALAEQGAKLRNLLQEAGAVGATDAIRPIEEALKNVLTKLREDGQKNPFEKTADAVGLATGALDTSTNRFATVIETLAPAAERFIKIIQDGWARIKGGDLESVANGISKDGGSNTLAIEISSAPRNISVNIDGNNVGDLDDIEVKKIVEKVRRELMSDFEDTMRKFEDKIRGR